MRGIHSPHKWPPFRPPFFRPLENLYSFDPYIGAKIRKCCISTPIFCQNLVECIVSTPPPPPPPPFWPIVAFRVNMRCWASLCETQPRTQSPAISQTTFSNAFCWMKIYEFWLRFHWSVFLMYELSIFQYWLRSWHGADQATSHYLNQWWLDHRRIYALLGLNELISSTQVSDSHLSPPGALQSRRASLQWT